MAIKQERGQSRYEKILAAAVEVFSQKGYKDAAVDDIAVGSETSKGGIYFHFPNKQAIFLVLLDKMANLLLQRITAALEAEPDALKKSDAALATVLKTFAGHRTMTRLFLVEALGAGQEFNAKIMEIHGRFSGLIKAYLDTAIAQGVIEPIDTELASAAWFGAINEVVTRWVLTDQPRELESVYPTLRLMLRRGLGIKDEG